MPRSPNPISWSTILGDIIEIWPVEGEGRTQWYWHCQADNGRIVCTSGEGYVNKADAIVAAARYHEPAQMFRPPGSGGKGRRQLLTADCDVCGRLCVRPVDADRAPLGPWLHVLVPPDQHAPVLSVGNVRGA
jgi:hypothetical protein